MYDWEELCIRDRYVQSSRESIKYFFVELEETGNNLYLSESKDDSEYVPDTSMEELVTETEHLNGYVW